MKPSSEQIIESPIGIILVAASEEGITHVTFCDKSPSISLRTSAMTRECAKQLREYFKGKRQVFDLPLAPEGTEFRLFVWMELMNIPFGITTDYKTIAEQIGNPGSIRAVGTANGKNPIAIIIPCHRVIGSDKSLTGYAGGLWRKRWLLRHEGVQIPATTPTLFD